MAGWYVHREQGAIVSAHAESQPGYAEELLDEEQDEELAAFMENARNPVPQEVTPLQMRRALRQLEVIGTVNAYVATLPEEDQEAWEYAVKIERDDARIGTACTLLGLDRDAVFRLAGSYP